MNDLTLDNIMRGFIYDIMADVHDKLTRSYNMSKIKSKNTKPEITVRSYLHKLGYRFSLHSDRLPGKPDIVLTKYKCVIFIHGCFWHRHSGCKYSYMPKSNTVFWHNKFKENIKRDERVMNDLKALGWKTIVVWQCELKHIDNVMKKIVEEINAKEEE